MSDHVDMELPSPTLALVHDPDDPTRGRTVVCRVGEYEVCTDTESESVDVYVDVYAETRRVAEFDADTAEQVAGALCAASARLRREQQGKDEQ